MKNRIDYLDSIKCFAIILVVLGHVLQNVLYRDSFEEMHVFRYIYAFHMPLFFMVSGFVAKFNYPCFTLNRIQKWAQRLLVPFFAFTFIIAIQYKSISYILKAFLYPDNSLWFLWALFWIKVIYSVIEDLYYRYGMSIWISVCFTFLTLTMISFMIGNIFSVSNIGRNIIYFAIGVFVGKNRLNEKSSLTVGVLLLLTFFIIGYFWKFQESMFLTGIKIFDKMTYLLTSFCIALIACFAILIIFGRFKSTSKLIKRIGTETLGIYGIHVVLINMLPVFNIYRERTVFAIFLTIILITSSLLILFLYDLFKKYVVILLQNIRNCCEAQEFTKKD